MKATSNKQQATSNKQQATSNKQQATSIRLCLIVLISLFYSSSFGQGTIPPGSGYWIENCYQEGAITTLISRDFKMLTETDYIEIIPLDQNGTRLPISTALTWTLSEYDTFQQNGYGFYSDIPLAIYVEETESWNYSTIEAFLTFNTSNGNFSEWFRFSEDVKSIVIRTLYWNAVLGAYTANSIELQIEEPENLINVNWTNECQTFDDFDFSAIHQIEGFCGEIEYNLIVPNGIPNTSIAGKIQVYPNVGNHPLNPPQFTDIFDIYCDNECSDPNNPIPINHPNPIPCGCIPFIDVEITIKPCVGRPKPPCEDIIYNLPISIPPFTLCCSCDIRQDVPIND